MRSNLVQKSVRLPTEVIDYIEQQKGDTFSAKFLNLMQEVMSGNETRQQRIASEERYLAELQDKANRYSSLIRSCSRVTATYEHLVNIINQELQELKPDTPGDKGG